MFLKIKYIVFSGEKGSKLVKKGKLVMNFFISTHVQVNPSILHLWLMF